MNQTGKETQTLPASSSDPYGSINDFPLAALIPSQCFLDWIQPADTICYLKGKVRMRRAHRRQVAATLTAERGRVMQPCLLCDAVCVDTVGVTAGSEDLPGLLRTDVASPVHWAGRKRWVQDDRFRSVFCRGGLDKQVSHRTLITRVQHPYLPHAEWKIKFLSP